MVQISEWFHRQTPGIKIALLLFLFPIMVPILVWADPKMPKFAKIGITAMVGLLVILALITSGEPPKNGEPGATPAAQETQTKPPEAAQPSAQTATEAAPVSDPAPVPTPAPAPVPAAAPAPAPIPAPTPEPATTGSFVGNASSKKLHNLAHGSCQNYVNMMNESNKVYFNSEAAGIAAGYQPCATCN